ncbi:MAG: PepSY-like domain-containing protein [Aequorivita sp.]
MKTLKILAVALFATSIAMAQDLNASDVPGNLKDAFNKEYPKATDVEWEKKLDNYKVEFDLNRQDHDVWYNASGTILKKEQEITEAELPQAIRDAIKSNYAGYRVDDVEMIWQNNSTTYEVELEKGQDEKHITFDGDAKVLKERAH